LALQTIVKTFSTSLWPSKVKLVYIYLLLYKVMSLLHILLVLVRWSKHQQFANSDHTDLSTTEKNSLYLLFKSL